MQGLLSPNFTFLDEKLWPVAGKQNFTSVTQGKHVNQKRKNWIFEKEIVSFSFSKAYLTQKLVFVAEKNVIGSGVASE